MTNLETVAEKLSGLIGREILYYEEKSEKKAGIPFCEKPFERTAEDGTYTYFRFAFQGKVYIGVLQGVDGQTAALAALLPAHFENNEDKEGKLSKKQFLKKVLSGESTPTLVYQYTRKFSLLDTSCFALVIDVPKMLGETVSLVAQYGGNTLDEAFETDDGRCALIKFCTAHTEVGSADYAEFLAQFIKEELGIDVTIGVGPVVKDLNDLALSYQQSLGALRYASTFGVKDRVHSYQDFLLVKLLEEVPQGKLEEYFALLSQEGLREIFDDGELLTTAEEFLRNNLNVSEGARALYLHRNTLTYRLDKIERATGLNIRTFADATSFRVLSILYKLIGR